MADSDDKREELPEARVVDRDAGERVQDPMRLVRIGGFLFALVIGWVFILYNNKFDPTPPVVFVCLGYLALLSGIYALWRTGVVVADENEDYADSTWVRPVGARGELEREKKSLLKAIKETEFDREMGKLSKADADEMITVYRARAIEVIKELDQLGSGEGTVREQILREVRARLELEDKTAAAKKSERKQQAKGAKAQSAANKPQTAEPTDDAATDAATATDTATAADTAATTDTAAASDIAARVEGAAS